MIINMAFAHITLETKMSSDNNLVSDDFVNALMESSVWKRTGVSVGSSIDEATEITEEAGPSARDLAIKLLDGLDREVILEFVSLLHSSILEEASEGKEEEETEEEGEEEEATEEETEEE
mgnify:CR=1 FL=1